jgi:hypothetical protein
MNKEITDLVERLKRIFPGLVLWEEDHYIIDDYCPPYKVDWFKILETLEKNGLTIKNIKDK